MLLPVLPLCHSDQPRTPSEAEGTAQGGICLSAGSTVEEWRDSVHQRNHSLQLRWSRSKLSRRFTTAHSAATIE
jgi:hypothetical protein